MDTTEALGGQIDTPPPVKPPSIKEGGVPRVGINGENQGEGGPILPLHARLD